MKTVHYSGKFLRFCTDDTFEFVERVNAKSVVAVIATTDVIVSGCVKPDRQYILTEQYRKAVDRMVIDIPAGLCGDIHTETTTIAALREMAEEVGYSAQNINWVARYPTTAGLTNETVEYFLCTNAYKISEGGGEPGTDEKIIVHTPSLWAIDTWLKDQIAAGKMIDPKVYVGLHFIDQSRTT